MDVVDEEILVAGAAILCCYLLMRRQRKKRLYKTRPINRDRQTHGFFKAYFLPMKRNDKQQFFKYTRMSVSSFEKLLEMIRPHLIRRKLPDSIDPEERLAITLHYFSQGSSMQTVAWKYHTGHATVHQIIKETAEAIWEVLSKTHLKPPSSEDEWLKIANEFESQWNFPNCIGALDGKHIEIQAPAGSGSQYFSYKKSFSIVLLACCDANYNFTLVDIGAYGSESDGGIFSNSVFGTMLDRNEMLVPAPRCLPRTNILQPFSLVADEAFPLKPYIMRPYPGRNLDPEKRIFNYRLSRARRVIENTFGILVNRWRLLRRTIVADVNNINLFIKAIVCLHNFAKKEAEMGNDCLYCPPNFLDTEEGFGRWRENINPLASVGRLSANRASQMLYTMRDNLKTYFFSEAGKVPWQDKCLYDGREII